MVLISCKMLSLPLPLPPPPPPPAPRPLPPPPPPPPPTSITSISQVKQLHSQLIKTQAPLPASFFSDVAALSALSPSPDDFLYARKLFQLHSPKPEIVHWNSRLSSLSSSPSPSSSRDALLLFSRLRHHDLLPDPFTLSFSLKACSHLPLPLPLGKSLHCLLIKLRLDADVFLLNTLLTLYSSRGPIADARLLFDKMPLRDVVSWNIIITRLTKLPGGEGMGAARAMFDDMPERSVRSWTAVIAGYVQARRPREAVGMFREMERDGMRPNEVTVVAVLAACADLGDLDLGTRVHEYSDSSGFGRNVRIRNTLVDMYIKCGCVEVARRVFDGMGGERTVVSWSATIGGHAMHGQGGAALELFGRMTRSGVRPNAVTFVGILHACSHMGLVEEGRRFFESMTKDYAIVPEIEHYGCMVDLLSRAGQLKEALEFIRSMPIKPNSVVWGALLGGARVHKSVEMGEEAIRHLVHLDPMNDGYYIVLSNIYAEVGRWEDAAKIRRLMRDNGVVKTPGWSTISVDGVVHEFVAGESDHPRIEEIYRKWEDLVKEMRAKGYVPDTSVVMLDMENEADKERVLYRHSEKLAVVFGLLTTPPGNVIRIMKNLRVCSDCHAALKLISEIVGREIVVRDRNRFHCFRDGSCSCRDYWFSGWRPLLGYTGHDVWNGAIHCKYNRERERVL